MQVTWPFLALPSARVIRVLVTESSTWKKGEGVADDIAAGTFSRDQNEGVSVFLVRSAEEEARAVAAHALGRGASIKDSTYVLRIRLWDLLRHRIAVRATSGDTGVFDVDLQHRDLHARLDRYQALTRTLLEARTRGADNVREIPGKLLARQFERFAALAQSRITPRTRRQLDHWTTSKKKG